MSTLNQLRAEWNALVPQAQARGLRVRHLNTVHESIAAGERRLAWLRAQLMIGAATVEWTFGVEIECLVSISRDEVARRITEAGVPCRAEMYGHSTPTQWKVVTDGSVHSQGNRSLNGIELVSPVLRGADGRAQVEKVCAALQAMGASINTTCGLHVHIGARSESLDFFKALARAYHTYQEVIDTTLPVSRRYNTYCRPLNSMHLNAINAVTNLRQIEGVWGSRYLKLNLASYGRHGTVEFRHHSGTIEATKVLEWVRLCQGLCTAARRGTALTAATIEGLAEFAGADVDYLRRRAARFA